MKSKFSTLLRIQLYNVFGINKLIHSHDKSEKQRSALVAFFGIVAIGLLVVYTTKFSHNLASAGLGNILPTLMVVILSLATLMLTFIKSTGVLIGLKDYDMVMSLPVNTISIVSSRVFMLYLINLLIGIIVMLPVSIVYVRSIQPPMSNYLFLVGTWILTPIIPMIISLSLGVLITAISSRSRFNNIFSLVLSTVAVLLIVFVSTKIQSMDMTRINDLGLAIAEVVNTFYPPATLITNTFLNTDWFSFIVFLLTSAIIGIAFTYIVSYFYKTLNTAVFSHYARKNYKIGHLHSSTPFIALYKRELKRLTSCTIYALNSCIGIVLLLVISIIFAFFMPVTVKEYLEIAGLKSIIQRILPIALCVFVSMTSTTSASLSLEGKNRWIMCSVPTKTKVIYHAKILVNLTVILPVLYISAILLRISIPCSIMQTIFMFLLPTIYDFFISVVGMYLNIKFPKYDWTSEYYAVKGGAISVLATVGIGMASSLIPLYLCILFAQAQTVIMLSMAGMICLATVSLYINICKTPLYI